MRYKTTGSRSKTTILFLKKQQKDDYKRQQDFLHDPTKNHKGRKVRRYQERLRTSILKTSPVNSALKLKPYQCIFLFGILVTAPVSATYTRIEEHNNQSDNKQLTNKTQGRVLFDDFNHRANATKTQGKVLFDDLNHRANSTKTQGRVLFDDLNHSANSTKTQGEVLANGINDKANTNKKSIEESPQYLNIEASYETLRNSSEANFDAVKKDTMDTLGISAKTNITDNTETTPTKTASTDTKLNCKKKDQKSIRKNLRAIAKLTGSSCAQTANTVYGMFTKSRTSSLLPRQAIDSCQEESSEFSQKITHLFGSTVNGVENQATANYIFFEKLKYNVIDFFQEKHQLLQDSYLNFTIKVTDGINRMAHLDAYLYNMTNKAIYHITSNITAYNEDIEAEQNKGNDTLSFTLTELKQSATQILYEKTDELYEEEADSTNTTTGELSTAIEPLNDTATEMETLLSQIQNDTLIQARQVYINHTYPIYQTVTAMPSYVNDFLARFITLDTSPEYIFILVMTSISFSTTTYICCKNSKQRTFRKTQKNIMKRTARELNTHTPEKEQPNKKTTVKNDDIELQPLVDSQNNPNALTEQQKINYRVRSFLQNAPSRMQEIHEQNTYMEQQHQLFNV